MTEEIRPIKIKRPTPENSRPVLLTILCLLSFIFFLFCSLLFAVGLTQAGWISKVTNQYVSTDLFTRADIVLLLVSALVLHLIALTGVVFIWFLRKSGYYMLGTACLIVAGYQLWRPEFTVVITGTYISLVVLFGLFIKKYK